METTIETTIDISCVGCQYYADTALKFNLSEEVDLSTLKIDFHDPSGDYPDSIAFFLGGEVLGFVAKDCLKKVTKFFLEADSAKQELRFVELLEYSRTPHGKLAWIVVRAIAE